MKISRDTDPASCVTISQKLAYSQMIRDWVNEIAEDFDAITRSAEIPLPDPRYPWSSGEWGQHHLDAERVKSRVMGREARRQKNRLLYQKPPRDDQ